MDNLSFTYVVLATVSVRQAFYTNKVCSKFETEPNLDFRLYPTEECRDVLRRLDMLVRPADRNGGFILLARALGKNAAGDDLLRFGPPATDKLTFWMELRNPDVMNFDDLPTTIDPGKIYHFTNDRSDGTAARSDLHLGAAATGVDGATDRIKRSAENYSFHHTTTVAPGAAKLKHLLSGVEIEPASIVVQSGESDLTFDLRSFPLGKCQLFIASTLKDEIYYAGSEGARAFGVVELRLANSLGGNYRIVEPDRSLTSERPAYSILFANRKTRWRYTIHLEPASPLFLEMAALSAPDKADFLNKLNITTNDGAITFSRGSTSDTDIVFASDTDLALQERYVSSTSTTHDSLSLTLKKYLGDVSKEAVVRSDLPYPHELIDARAAPVIFSDTFLTL